MDAPTRKPSRRNVRRWRFGRRSNGYGLPAGSRSTLSPALRILHWVAVATLVISALLRLDQGELLFAAVLLAAALSFAAIGSGALDERPGRGLRPALYVTLVAQVVLQVIWWLSPS